MKSAPLTFPLAVPGTDAYRRLRSCLDQATAPSSEAEVCWQASPDDSLGPEFRVRLRTRRFRTSPKPFAFLQLGLDGKILRFHPFAASAGEHELRISKTSGLTYLTDPRTGRTWVSTLGPFRTARRTAREASAVAIAAPFANLDAAQWCAPRLVRIAEWLKAQQNGLPVPELDGQQIQVELSGKVIAGLHIIDPVTGRQLVTLRSPSLRAGQALLAVQQGALKLLQNDVVVYFPVKDLIGRWGNQLTRSAIYASPEEARQRAGELQTHRELGRLATRVLASREAPGTDLVTQLETFDAVAETACSDHRGSIGLALALPRSFGGTRRIAFRLKDFGPHARFTPALWWVPHQGLMVFWTSAEGKVVAFGVSHHEVRRFGVFDSVEAARKATLLHPAVLTREAFVRRRERDSGTDLLARIATFNSANQILKADQSQVPIPNVFKGITERFQTPTTRGLWAPKILLSSGGPVLAMFAQTSARHPVWLAFQPRWKDKPEVQPLPPCAEGRGRLSLDALADLLSKQLSIRVTTIDPEVAMTTKLDDVHHVLRRAIPENLDEWHRKDRDAQVNLFYDFAESLKKALLSENAAHKREAILATEYFYFGKPCEQLLNLHAPLLKPDPVAWSAFLGEGGRADTRAKEMVRSLGAFAFELPKPGLPTSMQPRFAKFLDSVVHVVARE